MFGIPSLYLSRWNAIWVDRVTYTREWKKLTKETTEELLYGLMAVSFGLCNLEFLVLTRAPVHPSQA
jgi:hypothetical protein